MFIALVCVMAGCSGDSDIPASADTQVVLNDPDQCPVPGRDFAEQLFTETDRQWFCSVTTDTITTTDEVYFTRNGRAETTRFREVFWNRSLADQSINVASSFVSPFVIRNINSSNTVLTFDLVDESGGVEVYDCVLVGRELQAPELI